MKILICCLKYQCGRSRILIFTHSGCRIPDPGSLIPDLGSRIQKQQQNRGAKKKFLITFYVATNFTKLKIISVLKCRRKKLGQIFKELKNFLPKKLSLSSQKYGFGIRDPGSRGQKGTGSRGQKVTGSRIPNPDPKHCKILKIMTHLPLM